MERWKKFENDVHAYLKEAAKTLPLVVHRFYDSRSAGDMLPNQPGDFLIVHHGAATLLELKSSETHNSLRSCFSNAVPAAQIGQHIIWGRAGAKAWFLFLGADGRFESWPSSACQEARSTGQPLKNGTQRTFTKQADMLTAILNEV